jgi:hypothetical protein
MAEMDLIALGEVGRGKLLRSHIVGLQEINRENPNCKVEYFVSIV